MPRTPIADAANSHLDSSRKLTATTHTTPELAGGESSMRNMSPFCDENQMPLTAALLCHVMLLNSVLERRANRMAEEHGLTFPQWMALDCIGHGGENGVRHSEIGQRLMLSKAPITGLIDRLERAEYVQRVNDPSDRRAARVIISTRGYEVWEAVRVALESMSHETCASFSEQEQQNILSLLARLLDSAAAADPILNYSLQCPAQAIFAEPTQNAKPRTAKSVVAKSKTTKDATDTKDNAKTHVAARGTK